METRKFEPGTLVMLNSGGPDMTVVSTESSSDGILTVHCEWDNGNGKSQHSFPSATLTIKQDPAEKIRDQTPLGDMQLSPVENHILALLGRTHFKVDRLWRLANENQDAQLPVVSEQVSSETAWRSQMQRLSHSAQYWSGFATGLSLGTLAFLLARLVG